jgi:hypothetical protein
MGSELTDTVTKLLESVADRYNVRDADGFTIHGLHSATMHHLVFANTTNKMRL